MKPTSLAKPKVKYPYLSARKLALHQPRDSKTWAMVSAESWEATVQALNRPLILEYLTLALCSK
jgi:hypothetical protein